MRESLLGYLLVLWGVTVALPAHTQETRPPKGKLPDLVRAMRGSDVASGQFRLELPTIGKPLLVSWQTGRAPGYELLRMPTYDWHAHLLARGPLDWVAFSRVRPALELDCSSVPCVPTVEKTVGTELRLNLGGRGALPANHLFVRPETVLHPVRSHSRIGFGLAGSLNF